MLLLRSWQVDSLEKHWCGRVWCVWGIVNCVLCVCLCWCSVLCVGSKFQISNFFATGSFFCPKTQNPTPPPLDVPMSSGFISFFFDFQINNFNMAGTVVCCVPYPTVLLSAVLCCGLWARRSTAQHREHSILNTALLCWCFRTVVERNLQRCNQIFNTPSVKLLRLVLMKTRRYLWSCSRSRSS